MIYIIAAFILIAVCLWDIKYGPCCYAICDECYNPKKEVY